MERGNIEEIRREKYAARKARRRTLRIWKRQHAGKLKIDAGGAFQIKIGGTYYG